MSSTDFRIFKLDADIKTEVRDFHFDDLKKSGRLTDGSYRAGGSSSRSGEGLERDAGAAAQNRKDRRFSIDPLLEETMSVEEETQRRIDEKVEARLAEICEQAKLDATEAGYQEGLQRGHQEASAAFQLQAQAISDRVEVWLASCENAKSEIFAANERFLLEAIYRMGKMVLLKELVQDKDQIKRLVQSLIEKSAARDHIRVLVSPEDFDSVAEIKGDLKEKFANLKNFSVEPAQNLKRGGCVVETDWSISDASLETQLQNIYVALIGTADGHNPDPATPEQVKAAGDTSGAK